MNLLYVIIIIGIFYNLKKSFSKKPDFLSYISLKIIDRLKHLEFLDLESSSKLNNRISTENFKFCCKFDKGFGHNLHSENNHLNSITDLVLSIGFNLEKEKTDVQKIKNSNKRFVHIGLVVIGVKGLGRKELGTKVLTLLMDKSWTTNMKKAVISGTEVDLSQNSAIFYCLPSILKDINDLSNLKIRIKTKGYEEGYIGNNIIISVGVLGVV